MQKRRFRRKVGAKAKRADYPTLDQVDRRQFLSRMGLALAGATTLGAGLAACDGRAVDQTGGDGGEWTLAGTDQPPDAGPEPDAWELSGKVGDPTPDAGPEPDAWELSGGATPQDIPPRPRPDLGPDAESEEWEWDGFAGPPPPRADAGPDAE